MSNDFKYLCFRCKHYYIRYLKAYWSDTQYGYRKYHSEEEAYYCYGYERYVQKAKTKCPKFIDRKTPELIIGGDGMVKLKDIPSEAERIDLKELPQEAELIAISEKYKAGVEGSTGGLIITFKLRDGRTFPQKYSPVSGAVLGRAMKRLKLKDTKNLQDNWYNYKLTGMRIGLPRMIPDKKVT